jgi:hypothetical protein
MVQVPNSFVGRKRELAELRAAIEDLGAGRAHVFMVSGEPGIGKTRLAEEVASAASAKDARVVWGDVGRVEALPPTGLGCKFFADWFSSQVRPA